MKPLIEHHKRWYRPISVDTIQSITQLAVLTNLLIPSPQLMTTSSSSLNGVSKAVPVLLIIFLLTFPFKSDGSLSVMKVRVGSSPPRCVGKCFSCRPCTATLVTSQQHRISKDAFGYRAKSEEETYYLLSWKCKCGDKLFKP